MHDLWLLQWSVSVTMMMRELWLLQWQAMQTRASLEVEGFRAHAHEMKGEEGLRRDQRYFRTYTRVCAVHNVRLRSVSCVTVAMR